MTVSTLDDPLGLFSAIQYILLIRIRLTGEDQERTIAISVQNLVSAIEILEIEGLAIRDGII